MLNFPLIVTLLRVQNGQIGYSRFFTGINGLILVIMDDHPIASTGATEAHFGVQNLT